MKAKVIRTGFILFLLSTISWGSSVTENQPNTRILPDTGVVTSFTTTFGEDCDYTINPPAFTDNKDGTIADNVTIFFHGHDHFYGKQDLGGLVYQEVPQPGAKNVDLGTRAASYGYTQGRLLGGTGHLRLRVSPSGVTVDYVQT